MICGERQPNRERLGYHAAAVRRSDPAAGVGLEHSSGCPTLRSATSTATCAATSSRPAAITCARASPRWSGDRTRFTCSSMPNPPDEGGVSFLAEGDLVVDFDWSTQVTEVFIGAAGTNPPASADLSVWNGWNNHVQLRLSPNDPANQGLAAGTAGGTYIGRVNGRWQVRFVAPDQMCTAFPGSRCGPTSRFRTCAPRAGSPSDNRRHRQPVAAAAERRPPAGRCLRADQRAAELLPLGGTGGLRQ